MVLGESFFFRQNDIRNARSGSFGYLGIGVAHKFAHGVHHLVEEWLDSTKKSAVADRAAHNFSKDVPAAFV